MIPKTSQEEKRRHTKNDDVNQNHNDGDDDDDSVHKNSRKFQANILATMTPGAEFNRTHFCSLLSSAVYPHSMYFDISPPPNLLTTRKTLKTFAQSRVLGSGWAIPGIN